MLEAEEHPNFCKLIWPSDFKSDGRQFDAALLCYVLQTMPIENERHLVLKMLKKKLADDSYVLYMSRWGQKNGLPKSQALRDGFFTAPDREVHSFYTEFPTDETHELMKKYGFKRVKSLSERGTDQVFLYGKKSDTWI